MTVISSAQAALITGVYDFGSGDATVPTEANMVYGAFSRVGVSSRTPSPAGTFTSGQWRANPTINSSQYAQFVLTPNSGYYLSLQGVIFHDIINSKGPASGEVQIFLGNGLTLMGTQAFIPTTADATVNFSFPSFNTGNGESVTVRLYGWQSSNGGNDNQMSFDNVSFTGSLANVTPVPEPVNVALGIFAGVFGVVIVARSWPVRNRVERCQAAVVEWINAA